LTITVYLLMCHSSHYPAKHRWTVAVSTATTPILSGGTPAPTNLNSSRRSGYEDRAAVPFSDLTLQVFAQVFRRIRVGPDPTLRYSDGP
jgi:hypothetical protein